MTGQVMDLWLPGRAGSNPQDSCWDLGCARPARGDGRRNTSGCRT